MFQLTSACKKKGSIVIYWVKVGFIAGAVMEQNGIDFRRVLRWVQEPFVVGNMWV
jgi:hypothetical protein